MTPLFNTEHILSRRLLAWLLDVLIAAVLMAVLHLILAILGLVTFGLGWLLFGTLPAIPFLYSFLFLARDAATPGQRILGLAVAHHEDGRRPTTLEAFVSTILFYVSLTFLPLMLLPLFTRQHRTLHDLLSGLVVIRTSTRPAQSTGWALRGTAA